MSIFVIKSVENPQLREAATRYTTFMNDRNFHLTFCTICSNRKFDTNSGNLCSITNSKAEFENYCKYYIEEKEETNKIKEKLAQNIKSRYEDDIFGHVGLGNYYKNINLNDISEHEIDSDIIIQRGRSKFLGMYYLIFGIIPIVFFLTNLYRNVNLEKNDFIIFFSILVLLPLLLVYLGLKQILDKKSYFTADKYSFTINNKKIYFNDIVTIGVTNIDSSIGTTRKRFIVFGTKTQGLKEIELDGLNITESELFKIIKKRCITAV